MRTTTTLARVNANHGDVAQLVEHWPEESGVEGSNPSVPTTWPRLLNGIGSHPFKVRNAGSNPVRATIWLRFQ